MCYFYYAQFGKIAQISVLFWNASTASGSFCGNIKRVNYMIREILGSFFFVYAVP